MKSKISFICTAAILLTVTSCSGRQGADTGLISINYKELTDKGTVNLSDLFEEPEFIALDSRSPEAYATGGISISERHIGISSGYYQGNPYKLYDRATGKYLGTVGNVGRGPGEYLYLLGSFIDEKNNRIWLHDRPDVLHVYDLGTRQFVEDVPLAYNLGDYNYSKSAFTIDPEAGLITCARVPYPEDSDTTAAWQQDFKGNVIWSVSERGMSMASTNIEAISQWGILSNKNIPGSLDISFNTFNAAEDTLFIAENGALRPVFTMDLGKKAGTATDVQMIAISLALQDKILTDIQAPQPMKNGVVTFGSSATVITDRRNGEAYRCTIVNDYLGTGKCSPQPSGGYLIQSYDPALFRETASTALEEGRLSDSAKDRIRTILSDLSDEDNNIIVIYKLR